VGSQLTVAALASRPIRSKRLTREWFPALLPVTRPFAKAGRTPPTTRESASTTAPVDDDRGCGACAASVVVSHLKDLLATHLPDQLGMVVVNVLLYVRNKLVIGLALNVRSALAMNDLCHWLQFPDRLGPGGLSDLSSHLGLSHASFAGSAACAWAEREPGSESLAGSSTARARRLPSASADDRVSIPNLHCSSTTVRRAADMPVSQPKRRRPDRRRRDGCDRRARRSRRVPTLASASSPLRPRPTRCCSTRRRTRRRSVASGQDHRRRGRVFVKDGMSRLACEVAVKAAGPPRRMA
jgi:hypothetical protein